MNVKSITSIILTHQKNVVKEKFPQKTPLGERCVGGNLGLYGKPGETASIKQTTTGVITSILPEKYKLKEISLSFIFVPGSIPIISDVEKPHQRAFELWANRHKMF